MSLIPAHRASVRCPLRADSLREDVMSLLHEMNIHLGKWRIIPKAWINSAVDLSLSREELQELLNEPRTPDYVRMHALARIRELERNPFVCEGCGATFAEYINGCPKCSDKGLSFSVREV